MVSAGTTTPPGELRYAISLIQAHSLLRFELAETTVQDLCMPVPARNGAVRAEWMLRAWMLRACNTSAVLRKRMSELARMIMNNIILNFSNHVQSLLHRRIPLFHLIRHRRLSHRSRLRDSFLRDLLRSLDERRNLVRFESDGVDSFDSQFESIAIASVMQLSDEGRTRLTVQLSVRVH